MVDGHRVLIPRQTVGTGCGRRRQTCTSASKDVEKCRFWRVMYMFEIRVEIDRDGGVAELEGCPNFELCSKFIRSACADCAALKRATGAFSLRFAPWRVRIPPPPPYLLVRDSKQKSSHSRELSQPKWRRRRDSNPRDLIQAKRFSRPPHSTTLPPLRVG